MLDTDTKRRIDTARDILVGKVPDPKSQVEQITIALIYKFMDDMDAEAEELGGKRKFFTGDFARYGWAQLMRASLGGHEMLALYAEGITKMPENPGIPALFRDIFKNAYLPYRDPETLKAFLKIIDEFNYDHSERLGDAFEYLLSVLGSQGDAGQFRTPRHIIDFIVEILDPKKKESVLDPACGTAGFLISAYKHILKTNSTPAAVGSKTIDENDKAALDSSRIPPSRGDLLTPDERGKLATNFKGYDISPDMVRLSLVNLYLHGFTDPHIYEYDTLTSEERWNEFADVILANPPFMSPKGGIKPHRRFSIQAKRSEVLFVDYMAEHLTPNGRAGIIVPEGVIFQSQTAYTELRRMLVENSLVAVVSLPAGCFNPYSGVKTSILILDKSLAPQSDTIGFFKVENDGFGLGAQRRAIGGSDLPQIKIELNAYLHALRGKQSTAEFRPTCGLIVSKEKIAADGDYNLSGERYRKGSVSVSSWPFVSVGDVFRKSDQTVLPSSLDGPVTYLGLENITQNTGAIVGSVVTEKPADIKSLKNLFKPRDILYGKAPA
jgi:type I restriction enzyme M protein